MATYLLFADGGSRGNPGPGASGWVIFRSSHKFQGELSEIFELYKQQPVEQIWEGSQFFPQTTNNQAEWQGVLLALKQILETDQPEEVNLQIFLDSQLVVYQMQGKYRVKNKALKPFFQETKKLLQQIKSWEVRHIPRKYNYWADRLLNKCLDENE